MALPALAALAVYPTTIQTHFGIPGTISGLIINSFTPNATASVFEAEDEDTNPSVIIFHTQKLTYEVESLVKTRTADVANAHPGVQITENTVPMLVAGLTQNHPVVASGAYFLIMDPKRSATKGELDKHTFSLRRHGYTLSRYQS